MCTFGLYPHSVAIFHRSAMVPPGRGKCLMKLLQMNPVSQNTRKRRAEHSSELHEKKRFRKDPSRWSSEEDSLLNSAVDEYGPKQWTKVAERVGTRNATQCRQRWVKVLDPAISKGKWTREEDTLLVTLVAQKFKSWGDVASHIPGRTHKQCRDRWTQHLDPALNTDVFTDEEDQRLLQLHRDHGNKWATIAHVLGRAPNTVRSRWRALTNLPGDAVPRTTIRVRVQEIEGIHDAAQNIDGKRASAKPGASGKADPR